MSQTPCDHPAPTVAVQHRSGQIVWWVIALLLGLIATVLILRWDDQILLGRAWAQDISRVGARGIYAFTGQLSKNSYGLFMMDLDTGTVWCYELAPHRQGGYRLRLVAARSWLYDRYLEEFNVDEPSPSQVAKLVEKQRSHRQAAEGVRDDVNQQDEPAGPASNKITE